jgi:hypothetical protein
MAPELGSVVPRSDGSQFDPVTGRFVVVFEDMTNSACEYRQAVTYAFVSPLTTAGLGGMQAEDIALEGLKRAVAALSDLETVAAIQKAL